MKDKGARQTTNYLIQSESARLSMEILKQEALKEGYTQLDTDTFVKEVSLC